MVSSVRTRPQDVPEGAGVSSLRVRSGQLTMDFEVGVTVMHPALMDAVRARVATCGKPRKAIAPELGLSPGHLDRKLNQGEGDSARLTVDDLEKLCDYIGPGIILDWLIERYATPREDVRARVDAQLDALLPQLQALLAAKERA